MQSSGFIRNKYEELHKVNQKIQESFQKSMDITLIESLVEDYKKLNEDVTLVSFWSNIFFQKQQYVTAKSVLEEGILKYPFSFDLQFNLGLTQEMLGEKDKALYSYLKALKYSGESNKRLAESYINRMVGELAELYKGNSMKHSKIIAKANRIMSEQDERYFPMDKNKKSLIRQVRQKGTSEEHMTNLYKCVLLENVDDSTRYLAMTETLKGQEISGQTVFNLKDSAVIPVSLLEKETTFRLKENEKSYSFSQKELPFQRYHYLKFNNSGRLKINSNKPVFIGNPIYLKDAPKAKRLILNIFIDGLSFDFLQKNEWESFMPYTHSYFSKGIIATNCYATSEWTFPSVASMYTGNYTIRHGVFHPELIHPFAERNKMMQEYFKEAGYFTAQIGGDWRVTPEHGYYKGFDRILYQNFGGGIADGSKIISETLEHLELFKGKNQMLWISIADVHHVPDEVELNPIVQAQIPIAERANQTTKGTTTVLTGYDEHKHKRYLEEIKRIDFHLRSLYDYLDEQYSEDEVLIVLNSDHGQSFLEETSFLLSESRRRVPLMIRGASGVSGETEEFIELIDLLPILLHEAGIEIPSAIQGRLPKKFGGPEERNFAFTEAIHPGQTYKAAITDKNHIFHFENKENLSTNGLININDYTTKLININSNKDETEQFLEKSNYYEEYIWNHIKSHIKID
ncbi:sulfatase-like hydrolase/transferase [Saccharibacillus endophyticus]|uniref:Sulfatase n=1 Tax=Saccharibacillus endophyticus TaxID=2060666 RepID=A0ABQ2A9C7_9BACL|nr:sulfatase-like hydrolase/transferase [Saccharibacillus endophyticus]GGH87010.1 sulfatase [Saccharibacillus endophyticus]